MPQPGLHATLATSLACPASFPTKLGLDPYPTTPRKDDFSMLPSTVTKTVTRRKSRKQLILTTQSSSGKAPTWKIAKNKPGSAIREGGPRRLVSHAWRAATRQLLKNAKQPVLRDKRTISPRNGSDCQRTPPGFCKQKKFSRQKSALWEDIPSG